MFTTLQQKIIALSMVVVLLGIGTLTLFGSRVLHDELTEKIGQQQLSTATYLADTLQRELHWRLEMLEKIALTVNPEILSDQAQAQQFLEGGLIRHELFTGGLLLIGADGRATADSEPGWRRVGINYSDIESVALALRDGRAQVSAPIIGKRLQRPIIALTVPLHGAGGLVVGALSGIIDLSLPNFLGALTNKANALPQGYLLLVDPRQRLIITSSESRRVMEVLPPAGALPGIDRFIDGADGIGLVVTPRGEEVLAGVKHVPLTGWYVAVLLPASEVYAPIRALQLRLWLGAAVLMLLLGALFAWLQREKGRREQQLSLFQAAVEQNPNAIMIANREAKLVYVNQAFSRVTGYLANETIGRNPRFLQSGQTPATTYQAMWQALTGGKVWQGEIYNRRKNGETYVEFSRMAPIVDAAGQTTHYVAVTEDVSEKKQLALELDRHRHHLEQLVFERTMALGEANRALASHVELAESATRAKSAFLASMSHEIRTPMNAIIGLTHLAEQRASDQRQREYLQKTGIAAQHLLQIINDILDMSKIEAGKLSLHTQPFTLESVFESALSIMRDRAEEKGLVLSATIAANLQGSLIGDGNRLGQILLNFVSNAVKFTASGKVDCQAVCLEESVAGIHIRCSVRDSGIGIGEAEQSRLFQPFEQTREGQAQGQGGTGLGLAISRQLAEMMGGAIGVDSRPGHGSTFWFTAWLQRGSPEYIQPSLDIGTVFQRLQAFAGEPMLIVDDEPINREISNELLADHFTQIDQAEDGLQAVAMAARKPYRLILMDMQMPGLSGTQATERIRQMAHHRHTPIIAMTANAFAEDRAACLKAGMSEFISKPVAPEHLFAVVLAALAGAGVA